MNYKQTTFIPNKLLDSYLPELSESELKVLLVIIRQTFGWKNQTTGKRKYRDRITYAQFERKTGLSSRAITKAVKKLVLRKLIEVTDAKKNVLIFPQHRKGRYFLFYRSTL